MNRKILNIALPSIVTNITVPLLGLIDITISGHLGRTEFIGAIAVGAMIFNLIYWNFGFLRMGTAGMTAQCYGSGDHRAAAMVLLRATALSAAIAAVILLLQVPLLWLLMRVIGPSVQVADFARAYFYVCVWGAPAILADMAIKGWLLGMQDSRTPMVMAIGTNVANIITSLVAVFVLRMGFIGIPVGTVVAQYAGMAYGLAVIMRRHGGLLRGISWHQVLVASQLRRFFSVNADIFLRSLCLMIVNLFFVSVGARSGDITLAVNALIMQLFTLYSYFMDGFAFSGEALVGRFVGARDWSMLRSCVRHIFGWGAGVAAAFTLLYVAGAEWIFGFITDDAAVIAAAGEYHWWCVAIPLAGMAGFVWDGVYIGLTATRKMLLSIAAATAVYFAIYFTFPAAMGNHRLWLAFIAYLATRGLMQTLLYPHKL